MLRRYQLENVINNRYTNYKSIVENYNNKRIALSSNKYQIFLCHSSRDIDEIIKLKAYLKFMYNKDAYVCEIDDPQLDPSKANKKTAEVLKNRMKSCDELYFVLSKNSQDSTWMPWELGCFDGLKPSSKIYVYPIIENDENEVHSFKGHEYLELYPIKNS